MFGYVKPLKPELKICEYDTYKAVYCGLCRELGRSFGPFSRLTLSYDFTFLALLSMAVREEKPAFSKMRCFANPLKHCMSSERSFSLDFAANSAMVMLYYKVLDNRADRKGFGWLLATLALPFVRRARGKAMAKYPEIDRFVGTAMAEQAVLEGEGCPQVDRACEPTARSLECLCKALSEDPGQQRVLGRLGYLLGRYVYLCDALDDIEEDMAQKGYNPFLRRLAAGGEEPSQESLSPLREEAMGSLYLTTGEIEKTFELLTLYRYEGILGNVVHLGLRANVLQIQGKKEQTAYERSL